MPHPADCLGPASTFPLNESFRANGVPDKFTPTSWPYSVPQDLRRRLDAVLSTRHAGAPEVWGELRDWLEAKGAQVPEGIETETTPETAQRDQ